MVLSVVLRWLNSITNQSRLSVLFGFQQLFNGLSNNKSKLISRGNFSREKKTRGAPTLIPRGKFDWKLILISYKCVRRNTISSDSGGKSRFVPVFNDRWRVHSKSKSLLYVSGQFSRVVKIYYKKINYAARSCLKTTKLLVVHSFFYWNCWKQLSQATIEPQNSCDDSNLTDKWRHAIATGPGSSFCMNFFLYLLLCTNFFSWQFPLYEFFCFVSPPPPPP